MSDTIRKVDYYYVVVAHKPGEGAKVLSGSRAASTCSRSPVSKRTKGAARSRS